MVAPSLIPARLDRAGELTPVWVPDPAHEAMRDLVRLRLAAQGSFTRGSICSPSFCGTG